MPAAVETAQFAGQQVAGLAAGLASQVGRVAESPAPEPVHDLRVAIRRFTQALVSFPEYLPAREVKKIRRGLKDLMSLAGDVRDGDIALKKLLKIDSSPDLRSQIRQRRKDAAAKLVAAAKRWSAPPSLPVQPPESCSFPVLDDHARHVLPKIVKAFRKAGNRASSPKAPANDLHRCRIQTKKLRYSLELFQPSYGSAAEAWIKRIRGVQTLLGDINDCRTVRALLSDLGATKDADLSLKKTQKKKTRRFRKLWDGQFAPAAIRQWIQELRTPPRKPVGRSAARTLSSPKSMTA